MTKPSTTMTYAVSATTHRGGDASVQARTSTIAFDGTAQSGTVLFGTITNTLAAACALSGDVETIAPGAST